MEHLRENVTGFHTPGHQQGRACGQAYRGLMAKYCLQLDLTEISGLDNLKNPGGCLREAQDLTARVYGARQTFFLVNGATIGLHAALLALNKPGIEIIIPGNVHVSVLNGLVLSGGKPVFVSPAIEPVWGIPLGVTKEQLLSAVAGKTRINAVLISQPTYQGTGSNIAEICRAVKDTGIPLIADEAHGAHLYFQDSIPLSAQKCGADLVVQSTHKTLPALTQAAILHVNNTALVDPVRRALDMLQTSSPSYLLLASLDEAQARMSDEGQVLLENTLELAGQIHRMIGTLPGYRLLHDEVRPPWHHDPTKVVVSAAPLGLTGWELAALLRRKYGIEVEMSAYFYVLFLVNTGHVSADASKLYQALSDIGKHERKRPLPRADHLLDAGMMTRHSPRLALTPRDTFLAVKTAVPLDQAAGRIAGEAITVYPPGIPLVWPGEVLIREHLEVLSQAQRQELCVAGLAHDGTVCVVRDG